MTAHCGAGEQSGGLFTWYLFPFGKSRHLDPTRPMTSLKTVWTNIKTDAGIAERWRDTRHTLVTELAESGAGDQTITGCELLK